MERKRWIKYESNIQPHTAQTRKDAHERSGVNLYRINPICSARSLGPPRNADFIGKLLIQLISY